MSAQTAVPASHPMMIAWEAYKLTPDYANTKKWAETPNHPADGSLWAAFVQGWEARSRRPRGTVTLVSRTVRGPNGRTAVKLEPEFWKEIDELARKDNRSLAGYVANVVANHKEPITNLAAVLRYHVYLKGFPDAQAP